MSKIFKMSGNNFNKCVLPERIDKKVKPPFYNFSIEIEWVCAVDREKYYPLSTVCADNKVKLRLDSQTVTFNK